MIKLEAAKQCAKKRKEGSTDGKDNASNASSPPPPQAKKPKMMELSAEKDPAAKGNGKRQSLFANKIAADGSKDAKDKRTPGAPSSDDGMRNSIVVGDTIALKPAKKTTAGDPFTSFRDLNTFREEKFSPSPAPKPDRKPTTKAAVKEASGLKFDVSKPAAKQSNVTPRKKEAVKAAPANKVGDGKVIMKQPAAKTQEAAGDGMKQAKKSGLKGTVDQDYSTVAAPEQQGQAEIAMSGVTFTTPTGKYQEKTGQCTPDWFDTINVFTPNAYGLQATVEVDQVKVKPDWFDNATITPPALRRNAWYQEAEMNKQMKASALMAGQERLAGIHPKHKGFEIFTDNDGFMDAVEASSENDVSVAEENEDFEHVVHKDRKRSITSTRTLSPGVDFRYMPPVPEIEDIVATAAAVAGTVTPTPKLHMFVVTVSQPQDPNIDMESVCLTFPPAKTNWASFYCSLAMQLPVAERVTFAMAQTCKIRVPGQGQRKSRVFSFEMKHGATDTIWTNVMRMVAGLGDESEPVEVEFFP